MVVNEAAARRNHVGRVTDSKENFSVYSQATLDAEDKAFVMKIQDTVRAAVEEARFAQVVGKMQEAKAAQMYRQDSHMAVVILFRFSRGIARVIHSINS